MRIEEGQMAGRAKRDSTSHMDAAGAKYPIGSVANAARLLTLFIEKSELRLSDVAEELAVSPSTAHRLLTTLEAAEMVCQDDTTRLYRPGAVLTRIAVALTPSQSRWSHARPYMQLLSDRVGETVNLMVLEGQNVAFVESVESNTPVRVGSRLGAVMPANCISGGKILLAQLTDEQLEELYPDEPLPTLNSRSVTRLRELRTQLRKSLRQGFATNFGESEPGISGVAVLVPGENAQRSALAVAVPSARLERARVQELVGELTSTAKLLASQSR